ncbi:hypothetical protein [Aureispira anguillae]|uniref:HTH cro/C1-type domain-containing protein n=1 Tax=Aureispira anguillae TaxID=2864201 RepID=A0A915YD21_9BACT|nr:hypothetical protein [Aureispira anguillae]BDS10834.1 hypothetical protein AsAng_0015440 [Aureispira anguillae]
MSERERIEKIRFYLNLNKTSFAKVLGYTTPQSYTSYLNGSNNLSMRMVKAIKKHSPDISFDWILNGQGEMLISKSQSEPSNSIISTEIEQLKNKIEFLEKSLEDKEERLKDKEEWLKDREGRLKDKDKLIAFLEKSLEEK